MNADSRQHCLQRAYLRLAISFTPLLIVGWLVWQGWVGAAVFLFCTVLTTITIGTLVPRCALFGRMIKRLPQAGNRVLLTIDDGPHPQHTPAILDILDRHHIKAIFFLIGDRAAEHPDLVREIVARGHEVGNHTQTHPATSFWALRPAGLWREIAGCQETLTSICPEHPPRLFRPPAGHHNMFTALVAQALGLKMMLWDARGFDGVIQNVPFVTQRIRNRLKPGSIVLIHEATPIAIEVAQSVVAMLAESGLECGTTACLTHVQHDQVVVERRSAP
jgi:peptidoglycan/xylan/chitin deacetylase (PgdA/CDA1 family)